MSQYETVDTSNINESLLSSPILILTFAENCMSSTDSNR